MIIIPARLASTRFEKKVLTLVDGTPMVIATALRVKEIDEVVIATDSNEVMELARKYGIKAILTKSSHPSGTDRVFEAAQKLELKDSDLILNVQADEPFIEKEVVQALYDEINRNRNLDWFMASCYKEISKEEAKNENQVKVVIDKNSDSIYFSRALVPFDRDGKRDIYYGHLGLYGFNFKSLKTFCTLLPSFLENSEKLEQLRALSYGYKIKMIKVKSQSIGIDTKEDLIRSLKLFASK